MLEVPDWYVGLVSRETLEKLDEYAVLLRKWTQKINLISRLSEPDLERRHIWDSAQAYCQMNGEWIDIGSGGGLPGVVISILAQGEGARLKMTLVESDQRKATFLRTCARELSLNFKVITDRVEEMPVMQADIISARALAELGTLLEFSTPNLKKTGACVFMKGATWRDEIKSAQKKWQFSYDVTQSMTNPEAAILTLKEIERV